jgi:predicted GTPase
VFDAREGLTPLDRIFAEILRKRNKPVLVAANKSEGKAGDHGAAEANKSWAWASRSRSRASTAKAWPSSTPP